MNSKGDMGRIKKVKKGQIVLYQGEVAQWIYLIKKGIIKATSILSNGNEINVALFGAGDCFPVGVALDQSMVAMFDYEALTDTELEVYDADDFRKNHLNNTDELARVARCYIGALMHINALVQVSAKERILYVLRYLVSRFGVETNKIYSRIDIKLTQQDLARLANLSRETTSIELNKLKSKDVLVERAKYYSVNLQSLNKMIGDEALEKIKLTSQ